MLSEKLIKAPSKLGGYGNFARVPIDTGELLWRHDPNTEKYDPRFPEKLPATYRIGDRYYADLGDAHFTNHSCDPNSWFVDDYAIVARRDINAGEEVTYDYSFAEIPAVDSDKPWVRKWDCNCGADDCRGRIGSADLLNPVLLKRYENHIPSWALECIEVHRRLQL